MKSFTEIEISDLIDNLLNLISEKRDYFNNLFWGDSNLSWEENASAHEELEMTNDILSFCLNALLLTYEVYGYGNPTKFIKDTDQGIAFGDFKCFAKNEIKEMMPLFEYPSNVDYLLRSIPNFKNDIRDVLRFLMIKL